MPTSPEAVLLRALEAAITGDHTIIEEVFTEDVVAWSPNLSASNRAELEEEFAENDEALSNVVFSVDSVDVIGAKAIAEWRATAEHTGPLLIGDDLLVEPTGRRIVLAGASFAEFRGDKISALRTYFDDAALIEQLLIDV
ncbi:MAG: nuclear transport factor 2 family protein [Acidimicrobiales bacterium]